jgi:GTPase SAR1 family protein
VSPFIVVATQIDLRADEQTVQNMARGGQLPVATAQEEKLARDVGAMKYVECSAKTLEGVASVFDEVNMISAPLSRPC